MRAVSDTVRTTAGQQLLSRHECDFLLAYTRGEAHIAGNGVNWPVVIEAAKFHRVLPLLVTRLNGTVLPEETKIHIQESLDTTQERIERAYRGFASIADEAQRRNIPVIFFKGPVLAETMYATRNLRPFSDLDFIVPAEDLEKAEQMLIDLGYELGKLRFSDMGWMTGNRLASREHLPKEEVRKLYLEHHFHLPYTPIDRSKGVGIDLHWTLFRPTHATLPIAEFWQRSEMVTIAGRKVLTFSPSDTLLYLALHLSLDGYPRVRLMKLLDIVLMGERLSKQEWKDFASRATTYGVADLAYLGLWLSYHAFELPLPQIAEMLRKTSLRCCFLSVALSKKALLRCNSSSAEAAWDWTLGKPGLPIMHKMIRATAKQCLNRLGVYGAH